MMLDQDLIAKSQTQLRSFEEVKREVDDVRRSQGTRAGCLKHLKWSRRIVEVIVEDLKGESHEE